MTRCVNQRRRFSERPQLQFELQFENASSSIASSSNTADPPHIAPSRPPSIASSRAATLLPQARPPAARLASRQLPPTTTLPIPLEPALSPWPADTAVPLHQHTAEAFHQGHGEAERKMDVLHLGYQHAVQRCQLRVHERATGARVPVATRMELVYALQVPARQVVGGTGAQ